MTTTNFEDLIDRPLNTDGWVKARYMDLLHKYVSGVATEDEVNEWVVLMNYLEDFELAEGRN